MILLPDTENLGYNVKKGAILAVERKLRVVNYLIKKIMWIAS